MKPSNLLIWKRSQERNCCLTLRMDGVQKFYSPSAPSPSWSCYPIKGKFTNICPLPPPRGPFSPAQGSAQLQSPEPERPRVTQTHSGKQGAGAFLFLEKSEPPKSTATEGYCRSIAAKSAWPGPQEWSFLGNDTHRRLAQERPSHVISLFAERETEADLPSFCWLVILCTSGKGEVPSASPVPGLSPTLTGAASLSPGGESTAGQ